MALFRDQTPEDPAAIAAAYRKARFSMICNGAFFFVCCAVAVIVRTRAQIVSVGGGWIT